MVNNRYQYYDKIDKGCIFPLPLIYFKNSKGCNEIVLKTVLWIKGRFIFEER